MKIFSLHYPYFNPIMITLWRRLGRRWPTRIDLRIDPISPRRRRVSAGLHATDTLCHAYIDFLTYSDNHPSRQSGLCPESRAVANEYEGHKRTLPIISSSFWMAVVVKGLYNAISMTLYNPLTTIGSTVTHENWPTNWPDFAAAPARLGWPARNRHTVPCIHRFSHILR